MASERIGIDAASGIAAAALRGNRPSNEPSEPRNAPAPAKPPVQPSETTVTISQRAQELAAQDQQTVNLQAQTAQSAQSDEQASTEQTSERSAQLRRSYNLEA